MADVPPPDPELNLPQPEAGPFRWQAFFQRAREPLFLLNRHRRPLFVNRAWEELTGVSAAEARKHRCRRHPDPEPGSWQALGRVLAPPPEVLLGKPAHVRRLLVGGKAGRHWWDIDFFPIQDANGVLGILGRVSHVVMDLEVDPAPLTEELIALRQGMARLYTFDQLVSSLPALHRVADQARLAAQTSVPVLLLGQAGTGKEWVARTIHHHGLTHERTFAALDCARLPAAALTNVLFGEDGLVRRADVGTLYLREPSRLPRDLQARLCDWLNAGSADVLATPEAEEEAEKTRPRLIAGCSAEPAAEVAAGRLLDELHCRLATLVIALPALAERQADLPDLIERMLQRANGIDERRVVGLSPEAWEVMRAYRWPENLRELYSVLVGARAQAIARPVGAGERIEAADLPAYLRQTVNLERTPGPAPVRPLPLDQLLAEAEKRLIQLALRRAGGKYNRAAELLEIPRQRLWRRMKEFGLADSGDNAPEQ